MAPGRVVVVRSAPDLSRFVRRARRTRTCAAASAYLAAYLGVMGPQDGVDYALRALRSLRDDLGRDDLHCIFMGAGDAFDDMVALSEELGLDDMVEFTGPGPRRVRAALPVDRRRLPVAGPARTRSTTCRP